MIEHSVTLGFKIKLEKSVLLHLLYMLFIQSEAGDQGKGYKPSETVLPFLTDGSSALKVNGC